MLFSKLKSEFEKERRIWEKEIAEIISGVPIEDPEIYFIENEFFVEREELTVRLFLEKHLIALLTYDIRGTFVMMMDMRKGNLKNINIHKGFSVPDAWSVYALEELPHANLHRRY
jgi:hypothetical protein